MNYWSGLYLEGDNEMLVAGVNTMLQIAAKPLGMKTEEKETLLLEGDKDESQDPNGLKSEDV
jgi:hypothetical protein